VLFGFTTEDDHADRSIFGRDLGLGVTLDRHGDRES
jgi:hypothetical protein